MATEFLPTSPVSSNKEVENFGKHPHAEDTLICHTLCPPTLSHDHSVSDQLQEKMGNVSIETPFKKNV